MNEQLLIKLLEKAEGTIARLMLEVNRLNKEVNKCCNQNCNQGRNCVLDKEKK